MVYELKFINNLEVVLRFKGPWKQRGITLEWGPERLVSYL